MTLPGPSVVPADLDSFLDEQTVEAWSSSQLGRLPAAAQAELAPLTVRMRVAAGQMIYRQSDPPCFVLVVRGLARIRAQSMDGRYVTIRYMHPGDCVGIVTVVTDQQPVDAEAVTDCDVVFVDVGTLRRLATTQAQVGWVLARSAAASCIDVIDLMTGNLFLSVRQRVARHLLDLSENTDEGLVVKVGQQGIADAIGSVREVVARALRDLEASGLVERTKQYIRLTDPSALHRLVTESQVARRRA
jgi:CRP-like cAMP-binding protein